MRVVPNRAGFRGQRNRTAAGDLEWTKNARVVDTIQFTYQEANQIT